MSGVGEIADQKVRPVNPDDIRKLFPNASAACIARNASGPDDSRIRPHDSQPTQGNALVSAAPRKSKSRKGAVLGTARRRFITFRIFARRPADWDNYDVKEIQDCLRHAGLLDGDDWHLLQGTVISEKAYSKEEERTEVTIEPL